MPRRFGPGRVRHKLAEKLAKALADAGHEARTSPEKLWPNKGYWRCQGIKADVMPWNGQVELFRHGKWIAAAVASWETMGELVRGFSLEEESYLSFMLYADKPLTPRERYRHSTMSL